MDELYNSHVMLSNINAASHCVLSSHHKNRTRRNFTMNKNYGYIRVSTKEQNESRQLLAMHEAGIEKEMIYIDKQSGKDFCGRSTSA